MLPTILTVNPMAKKYRHKKHAHRAHAHRSIHRFHKHHRSHRHRHSVTNPFKIGRLGNMLVPAITGGAGAIGVDVGLAYASPFLPAFLTSGWGRIGAQVLAALGIGWAVGQVAGRTNGHVATAGALTITAYSALRQVLAPTLGANIKGLSGLADFTDFQANEGSVMTGVGPMGAYMRPGVGAYMRPSMGRLGYMNPASVLTGIRAKQMGAYMASRMGGFNGTYSEDM